MNGELEVKLNYDDGTNLVPAEGKSDEAITANAENNTCDTEVPTSDTMPSDDVAPLVNAPLVKGKGLRFLRRALCSLLAAAGMMSYGYLGYRGVVYLSEGGLTRAVLKGVFGGEVVTVPPQVIPDEDILPAGDAVENTSETEYLTVSSEDIGITDPNTVFNETDYDLDLESVAAWAPSFGSGDTVLVIHTHGTEGYAPEGDVPADEDFRSDDPENNVIAVGTAFAENLRSRGINVIHCKEMFDIESYIDAYTRSGKTVAEYVEKYPEISYVIDIHRDAVIRQNGTVVRSDGGAGAQLMIVCGTDEMGADFSRWRDNFAFGREYQQHLYEYDPKLVRHMNLRGASFNQQLCENYLLLEVGTCGNTLSEAISSAKTAADCFADLLLGE